MRQRHFSNSFPRFGIDPQDNNNHTPIEHSYFPTGRSIGQMNHNMSRHSGPHGINLEGSNRTNEYPSSSNITMELQIQPFVPTFPHPSITETRSLPPGGHHHAHYPNYNIPNTHDMEVGPLNHHTTINQGTLKRKRSGSLNNLYTEGTSSSSSSSSSQIPIEKPIIPPYRNSLTIDGQDSSRNVRRRYSNRHDDMEMEMESTSITRTHVPNHFYQPTPHPPNYVSAPVPHYPTPSHIRISPPGVSEPRHEMTQFHVGGSSHGPHGHHHHNHHHVNHSRRIQSSYDNGSRYNHYTHGGSSSTNGMRTPPPDNFSSRNSRHCSPGGWRGNYRSGRPRIFHSALDVTESHNRIEHENLMMVDRASFYGNSRNFSDQYRDLRLDIDNMSYEELLNLEERIGSVNTGLSEENMSKCLKEKLYYCLEQNHEEVSCPICLEEYKNGDNIGTMEKCGHGYHVECIKKWLLMKKLCPICKTEYSNQEQREG